MRHVTPFTDTWRRQAQVATPATQSLSEANLLADQVVTALTQRTWSAELSVQAKRILMGIPAPGSLVVALGPLLQPAEGIFKLPGLSGDAALAAYNSACATIRHELVERTLMRVGELLLKEIPGHRDPLIRVMAAVESRMRASLIAELTPLRNGALE